RLLEQLADVAQPARPRLVELLEVEGVLAAVLLLVGQDGVGVLLASEDQLLLAVAPPGRAPGLGRDRQGDRRHRHPYHEDDQEAALLTSQASRFTRLARSVPTSGEYVHQSTAPSITYSPGTGSVRSTRFQRPP